MKHKVASIQQSHCSLTFNLHSVCTIISTALISDVKLPYQAMLAISTELVISGVPPPTTISLL